MFYSQFILAKKGPLGTIWIAAHLERKLRKNQVTDTDIGVSVDSIIFPEVPIALRLSSHLMVGVVRIYSRKVNYLFHDCSEALLKIKQAFRSTAVDLPPEESTAPYHSITLPETFHLDDFELPETAFQGDIDHHVSTKEQITLQDNPERTAYSTSEFGLDERFGDGNSSHIGLDLEEELLLTKDHSIQLESDDGIIIQGRSSVYPTDMDVDDDVDNNPSKIHGAEGYVNMDDGPSHSNLNPLNTDVPSWSGYNVQTPDLNMLLHNEDGAGPSASYYQPSPFPCDEPASPEFVSAQAPATPGLMEETVPSRVHESPVLSPQRKASPASNDEVAKVDNVAVPPSDFLHSAAVDANDAVSAEPTGKVGLVKPVLVESSDGVQEIDSLRQQCAMPQQIQTSNLEVTVEKSVVSTDDIVVSGEMLASEATMEGVPLVENTSQLCADTSTEPCMIENPTQFNEEAFGLQGDNLLASNGLAEQNLEAIPPEMPHVDMASTGFQQNVEAIRFDLQGDNLLASNVLAEQNLEAIPPEMTHVDMASAGFQQNIEATPQEMAYNDRPNALSTSEFPERERMLSAPDIEFHQTYDLGQITAEKGITESDGSNKIGSLTSRKRHLEDSSPVPESATTDKLSSKLHGKRSAEAIPEDNDLLASILVGRRTPGLWLDSTPLPSKASSLKRPRLGSKTMTPKRKVQMDDAMVIHADIIRQQLISTEDIRRIRRKAPCTRSEIWMIEKGSLEDDIFHEPIFSCMCKDLNDLQYRTYETVPRLTAHNMELQGQLGMTGTTSSDINNVDISGAKDSATIADEFHMVLPDGAQLDAMLPETTDLLDATAAFGLQLPSDKHVNNIEGVTEFLFGDEKEIPLVDKTNADTNISPQVDALDKDRLQDAPADLQRSQDPPLFVLDDITHDSATMVTDAPDVVLDSSGPACAQAVDNMDGELTGIVQSDINAFENNKEMPTSEITGLEFTQDASAFPQPTDDENAMSAMGENSGLQENNRESFMDMDNMGHDFALKECSDFGSAIHGVDTDFLNYDDDVDFDDTNNDEPNPDEFQSHDALSGWSSRTRGVARYLKTLFDEESGLGRKNIAIDHLLRGKTRKEASRMFFETLVLSTKDYIHVDQPNPFDFVSVKPGPKLLKSDF
ncbi:sister chromatid cohesion 1 protein 4 [Brachypodium distachyon]|uniref:Rad21/Rec8-like protein N-terminal domain-containing protein n=1 Tax=Brachypodium distachyon TaxID=15368 RepID=I1HU85_BRADI|nr:sister chromatid cohesion 1 protein 4 [Brachypodium distachyon]KQK11021.1 hypothetical protein BRADI_2g57657v3 [Brachypodium distachyon]|eukprot:XP_010232686.1 sister chromatid cohesion 1 protein 4 [Brachypodium distachyon]